MITPRTIALRENVRKEIQKNQNQVKQVPLLLTMSVQQKLLDARSEALVIDYFLGKEYLYVYVISKDTFFLHRESMVAYDLDANLDRFQALLKVPESDSINRFKRLSYHLYDVLLEPILQVFKERSLIIIPDHKLGYLPFEVLLSDSLVLSSDAHPSYRNLPYLMMDYQINYQYSVVEFLREKISGTASKGYLGIAPVFEDEGATKQTHSFFRGLDDGIRPLPYSSEEILTSSKIMRGDHYLREGATKSEFLKSVPDYQIVHLSTHTIVDNLNPLYNSGFIFAKEQGHDTYEYLDLFELYGLRLSADLAVLSSCNTGSGKLQGGEGVLSLSRAFKYAGCDNIVMNLWEADDFTTSEIVQNFFKNVKNGYGKATSLTEAKRFFLSKVEDQDFTHPYYWASLVLIGDNAPIALDRRRPGASIWIAGFLILSILALLFKWNPFLWRT